MVFKRLLGAFGVGGPSVDTVLAVSRVSPGGSLSGEVRIKGGDFEAEIEHVTLGLVARIETEHSEGEHSGLGEFFRAEVSGPFKLGVGEERAIPFQVPVPWETPLTEVQGRPLSGMAMGVRTELAIAKAVDKGDLDPFSVAALPSQEAVLAGFSGLGFHFRSADLESGRLYGVQQSLPFYQEIEFYPPPQYAGLVNEVELTFVADAGRLEVILEADKRGGHGSGHDSFGRFQVSHEQALQMDWGAEITTWLNGLAGHRGAPYGGYHDDHHDHHGHHGHHGGPGMGAVVAAGAAGMVGGFVAAEAIDEIGDFFEGDEEEE
ncbi:MULTISPECIES: sporulation protein [Streptosporangium]|uniref:Sporulation-control protein n=1 Tax=Streptosporangium brasiliense TaxID=47480 RepID=A0ABT9RGU4_9ACTN|nr:sporulation protein [Streptosporangium brasiliense]MDP9867565.1 sporulation-control protein [Streptosporangium brasiliense]